MTHAAEGHDGHRGARPSATLLLVEDDDIQALLMTQALQQAGWRVLRVSDGHDAFELACFGATRPDLVIMDVLLPGLSGIAATRLLRDYERRRQLAPLPILGCSGLDRPQTLAAMARAGMDAVLHKPINTQVLVGQVGRLLARC